MIIQLPRGLKVAVVMLRLTIDGRELPNIFGHYLDLSSLSGAELIRPAAPMLQTHFQ